LQRKQEFTFVNTVKHMKKRQEKFRVISNQRQNHEYVVLTLQSSQTIPYIQPGQFAEVIAPHNDAYLRRPFSIHDVDYENNQIKLLIQEIGKGTRALAAIEEGQEVDMLYPLGKGYKLPPNEKVLLIGGGCGVAPLLHLGRYLKENNITPVFLIGTRSSDYLIRLDEYHKLGEVYITTEDGSEGHKGYVTDHPVMQDSNPQFSQIYTCGPDIMMRAVASYANKHNIPCQVSLENHMACGIGACLCCVTTTIEGHKCTCTDGPVFDSKYLQW